MAKIKCPKCSSCKIAPILYGYPAPDAFEAADRGELILGGCELLENGPDRGCVECGYKWSVNDFTATDIKKVRYKVFQNGPCCIDDMLTWVYEFFPDGKCVKYTCQARSRKYVIREEEQISKQKMMAMLIKLQKFIRCNKFVDFPGSVCDGGSYELQITYADNRKEIRKGDVGTWTYEVPVEQLICKVFMEE